MGDRLELRSSPFFQALFMFSQRTLDRYHELQEYVGWTNADAARVQSLAGIVGPHLPKVVDVFYAMVARNKTTAEVIRKGEFQIDRLKVTLLGWLRELFRGPYDREYVERRWRVGFRHAEIGMPQVYANVAMSLLRSSLGRIIRANWQAEMGPQSAGDEALHSLSLLLDLDLALIDDAYQTEHLERLQAAQRMATLGQIAGGVAHELRNPLNVMKTSVFLLLHAWGTPFEKVQEHLKRIDRQIDLANDVITALSDFARLPTPSTHSESLEGIVRESLELTPSHPGIAVDFDFPSDLPGVLVDRAQARIAFGNLIRNAQDAMPAGGRLAITARTNACGVEVAVTDTGVGIAPDVLERIMEPLFSTKPRGLGLGLAITRSIIERHQGDLRVTSEPGKGTTFYVHLLAAPFDVRP